MYIYLKNTREKRSRKRVSHLDCKRKPFFQHEVERPYVRADKIL